MKIRLALIMGLLSSVVAPAAKAASECGNFFGQRCLVALPTGVHMSYFDLGPHTGEVLIFLHTDTTSAVEWAWTVGALSALQPGLHIYALDQRGAGATDLPFNDTCWSKPNLCITQAQLAGDVVAFMDAKKIARATLVGHALGAAVAARVTLEHPERVVRLIMSGIGVTSASNTGSGIAAASAKPARPPFDPSLGMAALGWRKMLEGKGVKWPQGALHMRPIDIDPDAVRNISNHWDISVIAAPEVVATIAAQTAGESLASWGTLDPTPAGPEPTQRFEALSVATLVLWGSEDAGLDRESQSRLMELLKLASQNHEGMYFYWKQYGVRPPPASGDKHDADDIGHNLSWEAPKQYAADIDSFIRTGMPTRDLYRTDAPSDIRRILVEHGKANIVSSKPRERT